MSSWWHETARLFRFYLIVALIFALWGLIGGCAVFLFGAVYDHVFILVVVLGFLTALPVWARLTEATKAPGEGWFFLGPPTATLIPLAATIVVTVCAVSSGSDLALNQTSASFSTTTPIAESIFSGPDNAGS